MRAIVEYALRNRVVSYALTAILVLGGSAAYFALGQLEDPTFSVKTAVITASYPGATPEEVEQEVTDRIERKLQELGQLKELYSISSPGHSYVKVDIKPSYWAKDLPQVWDELRRKINDVWSSMPPGVSEPFIGDDFGQVFGFVLGLTGDGFSIGELETIAKDVQKELSLVNGVSRVDLWGVQRKVVYVDVSEQQLAELKMTPQAVLQTLKSQNLVTNSGFVDVGDTRMRIGLTGDFSSPEEIGELILRADTLSVLGTVVNSETSDARERVQSDVGGAVIRVKDVAKVYADYMDPPSTVMHLNGRPAIGIQIAGADDANIVTVGALLNERVEALVEQMPIGIELEKVAWQSEYVESAVNGFLVSFAQAVVIVLIVLIIPTGLRMGLIIGIDLVLTILATFLFMAIYAMPLERLSLGALIIAMGMMVDNSIVVADGIAVKLRQGADRMKAAADAAVENAYPLFAATIIAAMAFYPIAASTESTGEYCLSLFVVVSVSLLLSWLIAMILTPLQCVDLLPDPNPDDATGDEYDRPIYRGLRGLLGRLIRFRFITLTGLIALLIVSIIGFGSVRQMFFPDSSRAQLMVDVWMPLGTRIQDTENAALQLEEYWSDLEEVKSIASFVGSGPPRFYLPVEPQTPTPNYAQLVITFHDYREIDAFIEKQKDWGEENIPTALLRYTKFAVGPSNAWPFEARISGPRDATLDDIRDVSHKAYEILSTAEYGEVWRTDMMERVLSVTPQFDQKRARWSSISRADVANATRRGYDGVPVGLYREADDLYPIIWRLVPDERANFAAMMNSTQVRPQGSTNPVPLGQVVGEIDIAWEDARIIRYNRRRTVSMQGGPRAGATFPQLLAEIGPRFEAMELPTGYQIFWKGEKQSSEDSQKALLPGLIPAGIVIFFLIITVFNAVRPLVIIIATIPFAVIGITWGLLILDTPFGFMALLGAMSLAGMMNKNIVVLLDAAAANVEAGMSRYDAIVTAAVTRARPVMLAAGTTVLGVIPLLQDVFWVAMAVTIMAGLAFGSLLTLVVVPVLYSILYGVKEETSSDA